MVWCCKVNFNTNPSRLETKKGEPCTHLFKYINCKEKYLADSNSCLFWKHRFNREWYVKKPQELREIRADSIYSNISRNNNYKTP